MDKTKIDWADSTWNFAYGCSPVSEGCQNCYAAMQASRFHNEPGEMWHGLTVGRRWTGKVNFRPDLLSKPLEWRRARDIFVLSMSDIAYKEIPKSLFAAAFGVMAAVNLRHVSTRHRFLVLTKRPVDLADRLWPFEKKVHPAQHAMERALEHVINDELNECVNFKQGTLLEWPLSNVLYGVTIENMKTIGRIDQLRRIPAAGRFLSLEPLIGPIYLRGRLEGIDWVIIGGESGSKARECKEEWVRDIIEACCEAGVPVFVKQMGSFWHRKKGGTGNFKGNYPEFWPEDLRVREITQKGR